MSTSALASSTPSPTAAILAPVLFRKRQIAYVGKKLREIKGMHVISDNDGTVVTVYRNSDFQGKP